MKKNSSFTLIISLLALSLLQFISSILLLHPVYGAISKPDSPASAVSLWEATTPAPFTDQVTSIADSSAFTFEGDHFGAKFIKGITKAETFGSWDNLDQASRPYPTVSLRLAPGDRSKKGSNGIFYRNVGTYQGHPVDLKATITNYDFYEISNKPSAMIIWARTSQIGFYVAGEAWMDVCYEYFDGISGEPLDIKASMIFDDIDWGQGIEIIDNPGQLYVPSTSNLRCLSSDSSPVFISDPSWYDDTSVEGHTSIPDDCLMTQFEGNSQTQRFYCCYYFRDGYQDPKNHIRNFNDPEAYSLFIDNCDFFSYTGQPLAATIPCTPSKQVSDSDEKGQENTLTNLAEPFTYSIYHTVPNENPQNFYESYLLTDPLADCLSLSEAHVFDEKGNEVTDQFSIETKDNLVSFQSLTTDQASFYYNTYRFDLRVKVRNSASLEGFLAKEEDGSLHYQIANQAKISIQRRGLIEKNSNETQTRISNTYSGGKVVLQKTDAVSGRPLEEAVFTLYQWNRQSQDYEVREDLSYDAEKSLFVSTPLEASLQNLGKFKLVETKIPESYQGSWSKEFTLTKNDQIFDFHVTNQPTAAMTIHKTALVIHQNKNSSEERGSEASPIFVQAGDIIEYHLRIERQGRPGYLCPALTVEDSIPANAVWTKDSLMISGEITKPAAASKAKILSMEEKQKRIFWQIHDLDCGESLHLTYRVTAPAKSVLLKNTAYLKIPSEKEQVSETTWHKVQIPDLKASKISDIPDKSKVKKGSTISYTISISNQGDAPAKNLLLRDSIPKGSVYVPQSLSCSDQTARLSYQNDQNMVFALVPSLPPRATVRLRFQVEVSKASWEKEIINIAQYKISDSKDPETELVRDKGFHNTNTIRHYLTEEGSGKKSGKTPSSSSSPRQGASASSKAKSVKTSDQSHLFFLLSLFIASALLLGAVCNYRKK